MKPRFAPMPTAAPLGGKAGQTPVVRDSGDRFGLRLNAMSSRGDEVGEFRRFNEWEKFVGFLRKSRRDVAVV